ncbi:MAG TPA: hypothetical protein VGE44_11630 [Daejeonella sp.]|jgi:hypothetical protein|uniref:hypothetical protein n=1 Tax=Daejeonella sp. TaxID=2805397 RepID=UPI002EDB0ADC
MKLQELTTEELMSIGGAHGNFFFELFYAATRALALASDISDSLKSNSSFGNPMLYK